MSSVNKILIVPYENNGDFFAKWIEYLRPKHNLTKTEQKLLAACLETRYELSKVISDELVLDETCLNEFHREKIKRELGVSSQQFLNVISRLKKLKILIPRYSPYSEKVAYYKISPSFIPDYCEGEDFNVVLMFKQDDGGRKVQAPVERVQTSGEDDTEDSEAVGGLPQDKSGE